MLPVDKSDLAIMGMPSPQENRRATLVASVHQNSMWWNFFTLKRSDFGLWRTKFEKPTSSNDPSCLPIAVGFVAWFGSVLRVVLKSWRDFGFDKITLVSQTEIRVR